MAESLAQTGHKADNTVFENLSKKVEELEVTNDTTPLGGETRLVEEIESLCMNCQENGITRLLLVKIPFFREVILMSFSCPHCGLKNNEVQSAGQIQPKGVKWDLTVKSNVDLERQLVKSDTCVFRIEQLDLEQQAGPMKSQITTVEGAVTKVLTDLESEQPIRQQENPELHDAIDKVVQKIKTMLNGPGMPFTITLNDPAGNSWIGPVDAGQHGGKLSKDEYKRTPEMNATLGLGDYDETENEAEKTNGKADDGPGLDDVDIIEGKVYTLPGECPGCSRPCENNMQMVNIPHFKEVVIMSTVCEHCGYRTNEVKTGGAIPERGQRITLSVEGEEDLKRDVLKSEYCALYSPELTLEVQPGTLGGRFTTVEGILTQIRDQLRGQIFDIDDDNKGQEFKSDALLPGTKQKWIEFFNKLDEAIQAKIKYTLILEDPFANSFVSGSPSPSEDRQIKIEEYTRTDEEDEELGLKYMKTENYEAKDTSS